MNKNIIYIIFGIIIIGLIIIVLIYRKSKSTDKKLDCSFKGLKNLVDCSKNLNVCNSCIGNGYRCIKVDSKNPYQIKQENENNNPCMFVQNGNWCLL